MDPRAEFDLLQTRRTFFGRVGLRLGGTALALAGANLPTRPAPAAAIGPAFPPLPGLPHFAPRAKALIYLHMNGGPTQLDLWDHKPKLSQYFDQDLPESVRQGQRITTMTSGQKRFPVAPSMFKFTQHGKCGRWVSEAAKRRGRVR